MKIIVVLAALLAVAAAQTSGAILTTGIVHNGTSVNGTSTGTNVTSTTGNSTATSTTTTTTTTTTTSGSTSSSTSGTTSSSTSGTTSSSSSSGTTSSSTTSSTSSTSSSSSGVVGTTGHAAPVTVETTLWDFVSVDANITNACVSSNKTFTRNIVPGECAQYPIDAPVNVSVIPVFGGNGHNNVSLTFYINGCTTMIGTALFENGVCGWVTLFGNKVWVTSKWGSHLTTGVPTSSHATSSSTGDVGAGVAVVPSFIAIALATLFLLARFF